MNDDQEFLAEMLKKYPRYVKIGKHTGQVRMYGPAWDCCRAYVWNRERGICEDTGRPTILEKGHWQTMHCAHIKSKGSGGSDLPSNLRCLSLEAHAREHAGQKS